MTQKRAGCSTQTDDFNCRMFIIMDTDTLVKKSFVDDSTSFSTSKMPNYRLKLAKAISRGTLLTLTRLPDQALQETTFVSGFF